jgi:hypothetical protein
LLLDFLQPPFQFFCLGHRFIILALSAAGSRNNKQEICLP